MIPNNATLTDGVNFYKKGVNDFVFRFSDASQLWIRSAVDLSLLKPIKKKEEETSFDKIVNLPRLAKKPMFYCEERDTYVERKLPDKFADFCSHKLKDDCTIHELLIRLGEDNEHKIYKNLMRLIRRGVIIRLDKRICKVTGRMKFAYIKAKKQTQEV